MAAHSKRRMRSPNRPRGRTSRTSSHQDVDRRLGGGRIRRTTVRPRTTPTSSAATTTPQNEPSPPITTTTKAAVRISAPWPDGRRRWAPASRRPAPAARRRAPPRSPCRARARCRARRPCRGSARRPAPRGRTAFAATATRAPRHDEHGDAGSSGGSAIEEIADEDLAAEDRRDGVGQRRRAEDMRSACSATMASPKVSSSDRIGSDR